MGISLYKTQTIFKEPRDRSKERTRAPARPGRSTGKCYFLFKFAAKFPCIDHDSRSISRAFIFTHPWECRLTQGLQYRGHSERARHGHISRNTRLPTLHILYFGCNIYCTALILGPYSGFVVQAQCGHHDSPPGPSWSFLFLVSTGRHVGTINEWVFLLFPPQPRLLENSIPIYDYYIQYRERELPLTELKRMEGSRIS